MLNAVLWTGAGAMLGRKTRLRNNELEAEIGHHEQAMKEQNRLQCKEKHDDLDNERCAISSDMLL
jgi:hypothetical protein